ncbi:hypothetical protein [Haloplasma contractile]|uniref:Uncharacterized protein n=1 Tax=Haloplasma contractile SSD-17B TaxID=1033810 RepID=U2EB00_9MOLU|nr:hypothetical protein [Haloplasma contractile]ERJ11976.1 hypothetical protein HLPCO_001890 [Haloplasma contractile SSD-17B]
MVTVKWLKITELNNDVHGNVIKYGFKIFDARYECYSEQFDSLDKLLDLQSSEHILNYLMEKLPYFYKRIIEDTCFTLNNEVIDIESNQ